MRIAIALTLILFAVNSGARAWRDSFRIRPGSYWQFAAVITDTSLAVWCGAAAAWLMRG